MPLGDPLGDFAAHLNAERVRALPSAPSFDPERPGALGAPGAPSPLDLALYQAIRQAGSPAQYAYGPPPSSGAPSLGVLDWLGSVGQALGLALPGRGGIGAPPLMQRISGPHRAAVPTGESPAALAFQTERLYGEEGPLMLHALDPTTQRGLTFTLAPETPGFTDSRLGRLWVEDLSSVGTARFSLEDARRFGESVRAHLQTNGVKEVAFAPTTPSRLRLFELALGGRAQPLDTGGYLPSFVIPLESSRPRLPVPSLRP